MAENGHAVHKDGEYDNRNVEQVLQRIDPERMEDILENFEDFKAYLKDRLELGKKIGLNEEQLAVTAGKIGNYLARNMEPENREE